MAEEKFQVIIIGAGLAGLAAAYRLAKAGREVLVVEKALTPGTKNMTGGRIYTYALEALMPGEWADAPLEREVTREILMMMTADDCFAIDSSFGSIKQQSYSVLRAKLDAWLAEKAEAEGAMIIYGSTVTDLLVKDGKVAGVIIGDEEMEADVVISAEGVNALASERAGLIKTKAPKDMAVGLKYVYKLSEEIINQRFNSASGKGVALLCAGECNRGISGGAFIYTNKDSISIGLVVDTEGWKASGLPLAQVAEEFKQHPALLRYIEGGELIEYSAHLIPEGGFKSLPQLYADGFLVTGDAAGLVINRGITVRGMDYAIMSGIAAAETVNEAIEAGDYSKNRLKSYADRLRPFVLKDLETLKDSHDYIAHTKHMFTTYPALITGMMKNLYSVDGTPTKGAVGLVKQAIKGKVPYFDVFKDALKGGRSL
ncbi:FAD-dependent oxidoreductase [Desulfosporosinus fructosivorans]|uniref:FAD-dependent oxidoreductase n=1 Tax=Desulfosporosinus fructosivorans TaxID=2018669 RepID=A0A4Z0RAB1_9FIRM|nr:FAD-dependent oxidoreductase [Desulfosporosinus fructosivorans]TGE39275.1 FAD-dependent oxidoreductase [Desulfosporosinus fructosivorans]